MSRKYSVQSPADMRKECGEVLTQHLHGAARGWPLRSPSPRGRCTAGLNATSLSELRVLIIGDLALELPVKVTATRRQVLTSLRAGSGDPELPWSVSQPRVGGFVGYAARAVANLGARVSVCTVVPVPLPGRFERFLDHHGAGRSYLTGVPGRCPVNLLLRCTDGQVVLRRRSLAASACPSLPDSELAFDVVLVDARGLPDKGPLLRLLLRRLDRRADRTTVALRIDHRFGGDVSEAVSDDRVWTFIRRRDARLLAERADVPVLRSANGLVRFAHDWLGAARLVLLCGSTGAVLLNGTPRPSRARACPLLPGDSAYARDTLLAVTALASACGAADDTSIRRGVDAATGLAAGLPLPACFEELDAA